MRKSNIDMCEGPILSKMVRFFIPILLTGFLQQFFNAADVVLAGRLGTSGNDAVAAVGSTTALTGLLINFFIGCSSGSAVAVTHAVGTHSRDAIKKTVHTAMLLAVTLGAILTLLGLCASEWMLRMMNTPAEIIGLSADYLRAYFWGMIPYMVYNFGAAILRAVGETQKPLYFLLVSGPVKLLLTVLFVAVMKLDVTGLALATTCSQTVAAVLILIALFRRKDDCRLILKELKFYAKPLKRILRLGIPSGIQSTTFSLSGVFIQSAVNSLSHLSGFIAGNAAAASLENFAGIITGAFFQTGLNFTGQNTGACKYDRVKKIYLYLSLFSTGFIAVVSLLVCLFPIPLLSLYIEGDGEAIRWGTVRLLFLFVPLIFQGLMDVSGGCIRGMGSSFSPMIVALLGICGFRIVWMLTVFQMPAFHTPQWLYLCYPITWVITWLADLVLYVFIYKKKSKIMIGV